MKSLALASVALIALCASASAQVVPPGTNPVPAAGAYNASPPTIPSGQAGWLQIDAQGNLRTSGSSTFSGPLPAGTNNIGSVNAVPIGATNLATAQVSITTASTIAVAARAARQAVTITNITGTQPIFCSSATATLVNGQLIPGVPGANFTFPYVGVVNCIAATTAQTVSVTETY